MRSFEMHEDIRAASTPPAWVYTDLDFHDSLRDRVFAPSWQWLGDTERLKAPGHVRPATLLEGMLDEPILLTRDHEDRLHCLSNVCTHRGNLVAESEGVERGLRCRYHGRRFGLDGSFQSMPEFEEAKGFPSPADSLPRIPLETWARFLFCSLQPAVPFDSWIAPVRERCGWMPLDRAVLDPTRSREYLIQANWALYCDNYLEGFHIPFVHAGLSGVLDYGSYRTELFPHGNLQVGVAEGGEACFSLPPGSPDSGQKIAAYYFWLFPNTMLNFYPWGISVNVVRPLAVERTRVSFYSYVWDAGKLELGAGAALDRVEREDEAIVENVQRGLRSRLYGRGRYSPTREQGVHHFHRMLARAFP